MNRKSSTNFSFVPNIQNIGVVSITPTHKYIWYRMYINIFSLVYQILYNYSGKTNSRVPIITYRTRQLVLTIY